MKRNLKNIIILSVLAVFGISTIAFAFWGGGYGHMVGPGWLQKGSYYENLSSEEIAKLDQQQAEFLRATENTRQQLFEKDLALQSELREENPDTAKASRLRSEISKLQSDLDHKVLEYGIRPAQQPTITVAVEGGQGPRMGYGPRGGGSCMW